ncbi:hypothetical protein HDU84_008159 [Entophlyctis sp. JEL0112]|nr:hypothetical protein HDU84_008159 [Entophlyctis sp. JEL0112]
MLDDEESVARWLVAHPEAASRLFAKLSPTSAPSPSVTLEAANAFDSSSSPSSRASSPFRLHRQQTMPSHSKPSTLAATGSVQFTSPLGPPGGAKSFFNINHALVRTPSATSVDSDNNYVRPSDLQYELSRVLYSSLDLKTVIKKVLRFAVTIVDAEKCSCLLVDDANKELYPVSWDVLPDVTSVEKTFERIRRSSSFEAMEIPEPASRDNEPDAPQSAEIAVAKDNADTTARNGPRIKFGVGISGYVAASGKGLNISDAYQDSRFDPSEDKRSGFRTKSILCLPIFGGPISKRHPHGKLLAVASLINKRSSSQQQDHSPDNQSVFTDNDVSVFRNFLQTVGIAIHNSMLYESIKQKEEFALVESKKSDSLLKIAKSIYSMQSTADLFKEICFRAQDLTGADRVLLAIMNKEIDSLQLIFDSSLVSGSTCVQLGPKSISSRVLETKKPVILKGSGIEDGLIPEIDQDLYKLKSVLATPIFGRESEVIGVTIVLNKHISDGDEAISFNDSDIEIMEAFSTFVGLAVQKAMIHDALQKERERLAITVEIMSYHATARLDEVAYFTSLLDMSRVSISEIENPDFDPHLFHFTDDMLPLIVFNMFEDLGFRRQYQISKEKLSRYILTVRKNYRGNQYHNFTHATSVAHSLYLLAKQGVLRDFGFSDVEIHGMFLAAFNHDIDHRGTNNAFQKVANTSLASFYSSSTMERHHFNQRVLILFASTMTILNSVDHNILETMKVEEYKRCVEIIEKAILATDLALFFAIKQAALEIANSKTFRVDSGEHKHVAMSMAMTCSDLSAMSKKWENSWRTANSVYAEFFLQGDQEKRLGVPFTAEIMNRENEPRIPKMQVDFYEHIVLPAFSIFCGLAGPKTHKLIDDVTINAKKWADLAASGVPYKVEIDHA